MYNVADTKSVKSLTLQYRLHSETSKNTNTDTKANLPAADDQ